MKIQNKSFDIIHLYVKAIKTCIRNASNFFFFYYYATITTKHWIHPSYSAIDISKASCHKLSDELYLMLSYIVFRVIYHSRLCIVLTRTIWFNQLNPIICSTWNVIKVVLWKILQIRSVLSRSGYNYIVTLIYQTRII